VTPKGYTPSAGTGIHAVGGRPDNAYVGLAAALSPVDYEERERQRLAALRAARLLDTPPEEAFDRLTRLAGRLTGAPVAHISLMDRDRQFFKSIHGIPAEEALTELPREDGFCQVVVDSGLPLVVDDARADARVCEIPAAQHVAAYAGMPLKTSDGLTLGTFCLFDLEPREWAQEQIDILHDLAAAAATEIELRIAAEGARNREAELRLFAEQIPALAWTTDRELRVTSTYGSLAPELAGDDAAVVGRQLVDVLDVSEPAVCVDAHERALEGRRATFEFESRGRHLDVVVEPLRSDTDETDGTIALAVDVTAQRRLEEQLRQSQKMEAVGQLAAGIAHDFNNLLMGALGYSNLARTEVEPDSKLGTYLQRIEETSRRAATLTAQLLAFGRRQTLQPRTIDLNAFVAETLEMLRRVLGEHIRIVSTLEAPVAEICADPTQIQQVLFNLALNARDAMPSGGTLSIETGHVVLNHDCDLDLAAGGYVTLTVADDGVGMAPDVSERIFEPFFTTKGVGEGSGLGLPSVYGIVKQSRGDIEVTSEPGLGTTFRIFLPVA
jgi:signal transduction histidine kinase